MAGDDDDGLRKAVEITTLERVMRLRDSWAREEGFTAYPEERQDILAFADLIIHMAQRLA